uniref:Uncharacterized protein n=1 Tax=Acrobeloides nanus TaxID=290746 RepID=A0A914EFJ9_9BILA
MLEFAKSEFVDDQTIKFSDLAVDEVLATDLDEHIYTVYERKHENPSPSANRVKYRIKSVDGQMPYACNENGKPGTRLVCPTPKNGTRFWFCLLPSELCNGIQDCDNGEDEDPKFCMFYKAIRQQSMLSEIHF